MEAKRKALEEEAELQVQIKEFQRNMQKGDMYNEEEIIYKVQQRVHKAMLDKKMDMMGVAQLNEFIFDQAAKHIVSAKYTRDFGGDKEPDRFEDEGQSERRP